MCALGSFVTIVILKCSICRLLIKQSCYIWIPGVVQPCTTCIHITLLQNLNLNINEKQGCHGIIGFYADEIKQICTTLSFSPDQCNSFQYFNNHFLTWCRINMYTILYYRLFSQIFPNVDSSWIIVTPCSLKHDLDIVYKVVWWECVSVK